MRVFFFVPHQDDELLTMGAYAYNVISQNDDVHIVLCTDGSSSCVRKVLSNGKKCRFHLRRHCFNLSESAFAAARDREYYNSCRALGFSKKNIHISEYRAKDGKLTIDHAKLIIRETLKASYENDFQICAISPFGGRNQNPDHRNLGLAALELLNSGEISRLELLVEPYLVDAFKKICPQVLLKEHVADTAGRRAIRFAALSYYLWLPSKGRYAIGRHSIPNELRETIVNAKSFHYSADYLEAD